MDKRHMILTGEKQVGKSTAVDAFLARFSGSTGGFRTRAISLDGERSVHLLPVRGGEALPENRLFYPRRPECPEEAGARFDELGLQALSDAENRGLIVMDELGRREEKAVAFQRRVLQLLTGDTPVLAVVQQVPSAFLDRIRGCGNVQVLRVTRENRDALPELLEQWYRQHTQP